MYVPNALKPKHLTINSPMISDDKYVHRKPSSAAIIMT